MAYMTDHIVSLVEDSIGEVGVTLLVGGTVVTGTLVPLRLYAEWVADLISRGAAGERYISQPPRVPESIPADLIVEIQRERESGEKAASFSRFCLRNATVRAGAGMHWVEHPYLLISAAHVGAFTVGTTNDA